MDIDRVIDEIECSIRLIIEAVLGSDSQHPVIAVQRLKADGYLELRFWVLVRTPHMGALVGKRGRSAEHLRELVKARAVVLGCSESLDVRIIDRSEAAPAGLFAGVPHA